MRDDGMTRRLIDSLYVEALVMADEVRGYFDARGRAERERLTPADRISFTCESLKVTTRLMHIIAWLLTRRALAAGEIDRREAHDPSRRLGLVGATGVADLAMLPETAQALARASDDLYHRIHRLDAALARPAASSPARSLFARLESAF